MHTPVLLGGPYGLHVFVTESLLDEFRFPEEPAKDIYGKPSICAPKPTEDGEIIYKKSDRRNFFGNMIYNYQP